MLLSVRFFEGEKLAVAEEQIDGKKRACVLARACVRGCPRARIRGCIRARVHENVCEQVSFHLTLCLNLELNLYRRLTWEWPKVFVTYKRY